MIKELKDYKFVVEIPSYGDVYDYCFKNLKNIENIYLIKNHIIFKNKFENWVYNHHFTNKIWLPFRSFWNKRYYQNPFKKDDNIIFILSSPRYKINKYGAIENLRKRYPNCKIVLNLNDLVNIILLNRACSEKELEGLFSLYDLVVSFDYNDCKKYNLINNPLVYSAPKELENIEEDIDVYFCGRAKNRLDLILNTFDYLKKQGLNCLFILRDVPIEDRKDIDGLMYLEKFMSYKENLAYVKRSKCLLEIMQDGGNGYTLRTCEAVAYNKKIITNNLILKEAEFYDPKMIKCFDNVEEICVDFIKSNNFEYKNRHCFSPNKLLEKIVEKLSEQGDNK